MQLKEDEDLRMNKSQNSNSNIKLN